MRYDMKNFGFTLAEVLITLGIIGIVAAMTIPTLISNTNCQKFKTRYKKNLSALNQMAKMNSQKYDFDFASVKNCLNKDTDNPTTVNSICAIINGNITGKFATKYQEIITKHGVPYFQDVFNKATPDTMIKNQGVELYMYKMLDGSIFMFHSPMEGRSDDIACTLGGKTLAERLNERQFQKYCIAFIDVNGAELPNKEVRCSDGKSHTTDINSECIVPKNSAFMTDVYPIAIFDSTVAPASAAAKYVLGN